MLFSIQPRTSKCFPIFPYKYAKSLLNIIFILSLINISIIIKKFAFTIHHIIFPFTNIIFIIFPVICSLITLHFLTSYYYTIILNNIIYLTTLIFLCHASFHFEINLNIYFNHYIIISLFKKPYPF